MAEAMNGPVVRSPPCMMENQVKIEPGLKDVDAVAEPEICQH
jgi:hypothetical protein